MFFYTAKFTSPAFFPIKLFPPRSSLSRNFYLKKRRSKMPATREVVRLWLHFHVAIGCLRHCSQERILCRITRSEQTYFLCRIVISRGSKQWPQFAHGIARTRATNIVIRDHEKRRRRSCFFHVVSRWVSNNDYIFLRHICLDADRGGRESGDGQTKKIKQGSDLKLWRGKNWDSKSHFHLAFWLHRTSNQSTWLN